ncbi:MAG: hypothetical protein AAGI66_08235 [Cyanobacteria bacterium P01_H01_bin.74]
MPFPLTTPWHQKKRPVSSGLLSKASKNNQLLPALTAAPGYASAHSQRQFLRGLAYAILPLRTSNFRYFSNLLRGFTLWKNLLFEVGKLKKCTAEALEAVPL